MIGLLRKLFWPVATAEPATRTPAATARTTVAPRGQPADRGSSAVPMKLGVSPMFLDLLICAVFVLVLQMGEKEPPIAKGIQAPEVANIATEKPSKLIPLMGHEEGKRWTYRTADGQRLSASDTAAHVREAEGTPVLVVDASTDIQRVLDMQYALREQGLDVGVYAKKKGK